MSTPWKKRFTTMLLDKLLPQHHFPENIARFRDFIHFSIVLREIDLINMLSLFERGLKISESVRKKIAAYDRKLLPEEKIVLAKVFRWECWIFRILGEVKKSKTSGKRALDILGEVDERVIDRKYMNELAASIKNNLAIVLYTQGEIDKAIGLWNESKCHYEEIGSEKGVAMIYNYFGTVYKERGEYERAERMYTKLLCACERTKNMKEIGVAYVNLGANYIEQGKYSKAKKFLNKALKVHEKLGNQHGIGIVYSNLGLIHENQGEYDKAEEMYQKNLEIAEKTGYLLGIGIASANLGLVHHAKGELKKAERGYKRYLQINEEMNNLRGIGIGSLYLGGLCTELNRHKQAASYLNRAEEILTKLGDWSFLPLLYRNLTYLKLERFSQGTLKDVETYKKKLLHMAETRKAEKFKAFSLILQAGIKAYNNNWKAADASFAEAIKMLEAAKDRRSMAYAYSMYGRVRKEKGFKREATENLTKAKMLFKELKHARQ